MYAFCKLYPFHTLGLWTDCTPRCVPCMGIGGLGVCFQGSFGYAFSASDSRNFLSKTILGIHLSCKGGRPSHGANPAPLGIGEAEENWVRVLYICQTNGEVERWPIVTLSPVSPHTRPWLLECIFLKVESGTQSSFPWNYFLQSHRDSLILCLPFTGLCSHS